MYQLQNILFLVLLVSLLGTTIWFMASIWLKEEKKPIRRIHPEMLEVEEGTKLMGVTFKPKDSCSISEYKKLQERIDKIRTQLENDPELA
tara:strand:+ start:4261 stop:4530 length:270 start_codon:yes stop_codon:yes gene_type:complete